jgi:hypothetical protein
MAVVTGIAAIGLVVAFIGTRLAARQAPMAAAAAAIEPVAEALPEREAA